MTLSLMTLRIYGLRLKLKTEIAAATPPKENTIRAPLSLSGRALFFLLVTELDLDFSQRNETIYIFAPHLSFCGLFLYFSELLPSPVRPFVFL